MNSKNELPTTYKAFEGRGSRDILDLSGLFSDSYRLYIVIRKCTFQDYDTALLEKRKFLEVLTYMLYHFGLDNVRSTEETIF